MRVKKLLLPLLATSCLISVFLYAHPTLGLTGRLSIDSFLKDWNSTYKAKSRTTAEEPFFDALAEAAEERTKSVVRYDGRYVSIPYPMGDVPAEIGVCTDEVIRSYRAVGVDLQRLVHEDMVKHFSDYPRIWGRSRTDSNIDHRRVPNLMVFLKTFGDSLALSTDPTTYQPGDIVAWRLSNGLLHIGLVARKRTGDGARPLVVHNIGAGPKMEDALFVGEVVGHFRFRMKDK